MSDRYVRLDELAAYSSLSPRNLRRYRDAPVHPLPCHRIGGCVLFKLSEFDAWLAEHEERTARPPDRAYQIALAIRGHK
jgi:hypothetical protein